MTKNMKNFLKQDIHKKVLYGFIFILLPVVAFLLISSRTSLLFGIRTFTVLTGSMKPTIQVDSLLFTIPEKEYKVSDIITFKRNDVNITHRIVGIQNNQYVTKGDANQSADPILVSKELIVGKTFFTLPYVGKVTSITKTVPGFILLIALPTLAFIWFEGKTIKEEWEKEIEKKLVSKLKTAEQVVESEIKKV